MSLQTGAFALDQDIPQKVIYSDANYTSTSDSALNRRHLRIPPKNDQIYKPTSSSEIIFDIASSTSFIDWNNFYIEGFFDNGINSNTDALFSSTTGSVIERGGVHACFASMELRNAATGLAVEVQDRYNLLKSIKTTTEDSYDDADDLRMCSLDSSRDSGYFIDFGSHTGIKVINLLAAAAITYTAPGAPDKFGQIVLNTTNITGGGYTLNNLPLFVGDRIRFNSVAAGVEANAVDVEFLIVAVSQTSAISVTLNVVGCDPTGFPGLTIPINSEVTIISYGHSVNPRSFIADPDVWGTSKTRFCIKPDLGFMKTNKLYPLFLHPNGMQLIIRLDTLTFHTFTRENSHITPATGAAWTYALSDLRASFPVYDFHSSINKQYVDAYRSPRGLLFPYMMYYSSEDLLDTSAGFIVKEANPGVRSARKVIARLTSDKIYSSSSAMSHYNSCLSLHPRLGLRKYQFTSGSLTFPVREIEVGATTAAILAFNATSMSYMNNRKHQEIYNKMHMDRFQVAFDGAEPYNGNSGTRMRFGDLIDAQRRIRVDSGDNPAPDTKTFFMTAILGREEEGRFSGLDLSIQPLRCEMTFDALVNTSNLANKRVLHMFIMCDTYLHLGDSTGSTKLN